VTESSGTRVEPGLTALGDAPPALFQVRGPMAPPDGPDTLAGVARVYFAHKSTLLILASALPLLAFRIYLGDWGLRDLYALAVAAVGWPVFEWVFHVLIHLPPPRIGGRTLDMLPAREHRLHHIDPTIVDHTLMPRGVIVILAALSIGGFWMLLGTPLGLTAALCFHLGGLLNGWVHLLTHMPYAPRSRFFRWVRRTHLLHHFKNERYWFAFTGPFVDVAFGTHRNPQSVPTSPACRSGARSPA
jgi:sterol desaturase/sphingolipid hydroxylase (fatty acid hydroxylase superfamily)